MLTVLVTIYRIYTCATPEQAATRLQALLNATDRPGSQGSYRKISEQDVAELVPLDDRFQGQGREVISVLQQMIRAGLPVYLFEID